MAIMLVLGLVYCFIFYYQERTQATAECVCSNFKLELMVVPNLVRISNALINLWL